MTFDEYAALDGLALAALVRRGAVSADELLDVALARLEAVNPRINAIAHRFEGLARSAIARGLPDGPFQGVPFLTKDLYAAVAGAPLTNGSRAWLGWTAPADGELVRRYRAAGLSIFASTTSPEFGLTPTTENKVQGDTCNPWRLDRIPGGSSGGAAAAVAAGIAPMAHASDGGGSIRTPASCCGLFGLKPSRGRVVRGPERTEGWNGMSVNHAVTRSVRDSAALLDLTSGLEPGSRYVAPPPPEGGFLADCDRGPGRLRVAVWARTWDDAPLHPDCAAAVADAAALLDDLGHHVEEARPPIDPEALGRAMLAILFSSVRHSLDERGAMRGRPVGDDEIESLTAIYRDRGGATTALALQEAFAVQERFAVALAGFFARHDVILCATQNAPPPPHGALSLSHPDPRVYGGNVAAFSAMTSAANHAGTPAMSLPLSWNAEGLPIGVMAMAGYGEEARLLRLARQVEEARPWGMRRPPL